MSAELIIERSPFGLRAGLLEDGRLLEVDQLDEPVDARGDIVLGRVRAVDPDLGAAFVDCGLASDAFLSARDARHLPGAGRDQPIERMVSEGQAVLVQVRQEAAAGKAARVTGDIALVGAYLVLRPRRRGISLSARLQRTPAAAEQRARAVALFPDDGGITLRRAAALASDAELLAELARLRETWAEIEAAARGARPPARLYGVDDPLHRLLLEHVAPDLERIVIGDQASLVRARNWLLEWQPGLAPRLESVADPFEATGAAEQLEEALQPTVPLPGGGSLIIEPTAAFTAIDVNAGGRQALEANLAAAREIARQLRLRRIGGTVVIDFIDLPSRPLRARVLSALRDAVADDPAPVQVFWMSRFGLVELSRKRAGPSLAEMLGRPCPVCAGAGTLPALRWRAEQLLRQLANLPPRGARVLVAPDLHDYLSGVGRAAWEAVAGRHGQGITLGRDQALPPGGHCIEEVS